MLFNQLKVEEVKINQIHINAEFETNYLDLSETPSEETNENLILDLKTKIVIQVPWFYQIRGLTLKGQENKKIYVDFKFLISPKNDMKFVELKINVPYRHYEYYDFYEELTQELRKKNDMKFFFEILDEYRYTFFHKEEVIKELTKKIEEIEIGLKEEEACIRNPFLYSESNIKDLERRIERIKKLTIEKVDKYELYSVKEFLKAQENIDMFEDKLVSSVLKQLEKDKFIISNEPIEDRGYFSKYYL